MSYPYTEVKLFIKNDSDVAVFIVDILSEIFNIEGIILSSRGYIVSIKNKGGDSNGGQKEAEEKEGQES